LAYDENTEQGAGSGHCPKVPALTSRTGPPPNGY